MDASTNAKDGNDSKCPGSDFNFLGCTVSGLLSLLEILLGNWSSLLRVGNVSVVDLLLWSWTRSYGHNYHWFSLMDLWV